MHCVTRAGCVRVYTVQDQSSDADPLQSAGGRRERRRAVDVARALPADVRHVASAGAPTRHGRVPAAFRLVDAERRPAAAPHRRPLGRPRPVVGLRHQRGRRRRVLRPQRRLAAHVHHRRRARGAVVKNMFKKLFD